MENKKNSGLLYGVGGLLGIFLLTVFDQWTKYLAVLHLKGQKSIELISGVFELQYLENRGAAFGMMQNQQWFFILLTVAYLAAVVVIYFKIPRTKRFFLLHFLAVLLTSGALGNFIDRVRLQYVVDFFYFSLIDFPIFNVADIYVVASFFLLVFCTLFVYKDEEFAFLSFKKADVNAQKKCE